ncbi:hypothetical protein CCACVL1_17910 [Corchorus capsularis]|uniref:Uncharacterized protein n=1 Tax=Corchorus capsularis TaxID=210143 RepID=A0A1R3HPU0_COCAP|nr:hypothetical protein CCACVL1_17910 [Corchorus capsularis]
MVKDFGDSDSDEHTGQKARRAYAPGQARRPVEPSVLG